MEYSSSSKRNIYSCICCYVSIVSISPRTSFRIRYKSFIYEIRRVCISRIRSSLRAMSCYFLTSNIASVYRTSLICGSNSNILASVNRGATSHSSR
nr:MAG TPA: hypothetical protein [Caudoviricetes sp.]